MLEREIKYFEEHRDELLAKHRHQFVLIKGDQLIDAFQTIEQALSEGTRRFGLDSYLVRQVEESEQPITIPALTLGILGANTPHPVRGPR
jgi:hypothetical protein